MTGRKIDRQDPEPSHAGGVVYRRESGSIRFLLVTAKKNQEDWVLPKGHIEPGESAEHTAQREVLEEAGIRARIDGALEMIEFEAAGESVRARFFLMEAVGEGVPEEERRTAWCRYEKAMEMLPFPQARELIRQASLLLEKRWPQLGI